MQAITEGLRRLLVGKLQASSDGFRARVTIGADDTEVGPPIRVSIDKSLRLTADQLEVEFQNEDLPLGWAITSVFPTNERIKVWQWYGDEVNAVRTFTGIVDKVVDARDPLNTVVTCRDLMGILVDQTFSTSAPQGAGEADAVRTPANGVFLNMEVHDIITFILDQVGWPADDRIISITSFVLDEYVVADGTAWSDAIIGDTSLTGLTGYDAWADEFGFFHFEPTPSSDLVTVAPDITYVWKAGVDIVSLSDSTDQYDLITRVKTRGPLTTLKDAWTMLWQTKKITDPVGIWFDPTAPANIQVVDNNARRVYRLRQSDRQVISSWSISTICPHPLGISGDPSDSSIYWLLNAPWIDGVSGGNQIVKVRKSDNHSLAHYSLASGRWSAIKVSGSFIWLTNLDTDEIHKMSKTTGAQIAAYHQSYLGDVQANPSGLMIDGTTLHVFWSNGGTTARFLLADETAPTAITGVVKTTGTTLHGGEMDTVTHTDCWGDSDSLGLVAKFSLVSPVTSQVASEVVDTDLEDELGALAQLEDRVHDTHPLDPPHPWESRRMSLDLSVISSLSQAADVARFTLDKLGRRNRVLDVGILGNPPIQKNDLVQIQDPVSGILQNFVVDTYRTEMQGTYVGTMSLVRGGVANDEITEPLPPPTDGTGNSVNDDGPLPDTFDATFVYTSDGYGLSSGPPPAGVNHTVSSDNTAPFRLYEGDVVSYSFTITGDSRDSRVQLGFGSGVASWVSLHYDGGGDSPPKTITGTYTVIAATGIGGPHGGVGAADLWAMSELDAYTHSPHTTTVVVHLDITRS